MLNDRLFTVCLLAGVKGGGELHPLDGRGGVIHWMGCIQGDAYTGGGGVPRGCILDAPLPPCEQNDTRLRKHYLPPYAVCGRQKYISSKSVK